MRPILDVAGDLGLVPDELMLFGPHMAKLTLAKVRSLEARGPSGRIVLVSAMNPTKHGEGKTTLSIALAQGLRRRGKKVALALREPSLGPIFGMKGGGTGGGRSILEPSARINMHFTGDLHAVTSANNLLAALCDNAVNFPGKVELDPRRIVWRRALDMNDRFLRRMVVGLGGPSNGVPREDGFDITAASEVMAILCLSKGIADLKARLGRILVGFDRGGRPVTAGDLQAAGAMAALLADAMQPNLVQSAEGVPALVHGGPFGNIAHGCNSIIATRSAAALADYVVTEAGFGFDLGAEKFFDIKCRTAGLWPRAVVLVVTARALRYHGGDLELTTSGAASHQAIERGLANVDRHVASARVFGFDPVVAINVFHQDSEEELRVIEAGCRARGIEVARCHGFAQGGAGSEELADKVAAAADRPAPLPRFLYPLEDSAEDKIRAVAKTLYGAREVVFTREARADLERFRAMGFTGTPVCIAKTHLSLSDQPSAVGCPKDFELTVKSVRMSAGAGFLLVLTGDIVTMPGLPRVPAAQHLDLTEEGEVTGLA